MSLPLQTERVARAEATARLRSIVQVCLSAAARNHVRVLDTPTRIINKNTPQIIISHAHCMPKKLVRPKPDQPDRLLRPCTEPSSSVLIKCDIAQTHPYKPQNWFLHIFLLILVYLKPQKITPHFFVFPTPFSESFSIFSQFYLLNNAFHIKTNHISEFLTFFY